MPVGVQVDILSWGQEQFGDPCSGGQEHESDTIYGYYNGGPCAQDDFPNPHRKGIGEQNEKESETGTPRATSSIKANLKIYGCD